MPAYIDGPIHDGFETIDLGQFSSGDRKADLSTEMTEALEHAPTGECVCWGIPFLVGTTAVVSRGQVDIPFGPIKAKWLVFLHVTDKGETAPEADGFYRPMRGFGNLNQPAAQYRMSYSDDTHIDVEIRRRYQIGAFSRIWGENCFEAVAMKKPVPVRPHHEQARRSWGISQTRASANDAGPWVSWLWCWENPHPEKEITGVSLVPGPVPVVLHGITAGRVEERPVRWLSRRKALIDLSAFPDAGEFDPQLDENGLYGQIRLDMGQVISAQRQPLYPNDTWEQTDNNFQPEVSPSGVLVEYTAHPDARFHLPNGKKVSVRDLSGSSRNDPVISVGEAKRRITVRALDRLTGKAVPVKLHVHGEHGEYCAPVDRHRIPNPAWFEDYSTDFVHMPAAESAGPNGLPLGRHYCTYIPGESVIDVPEGRIFIEVSKGYEIKPVRMVADITRDTAEVVVDIETVLPWRKRGWVSSDTHVHFLSPPTALMEGSAEGVNLVNLLASQWGELMTNVGDFDGETTLGSREAGGDGEYLVRVGTENRQHVMGHISLLGYEGSIIAPMTTGGPDESALGDPIGILLTEWAEMCKRQNGVVVIPHFPGPRLENAATIVRGMADGVEMTSWGNLYGGINPYSLSDWYRYLNCGYPVAAVGGTDKMSASTAVGTVRTYVRLSEDTPFSLDAWKAAIRSGETFVTYGPLLEFSVEGKSMGMTANLGRAGGTVAVEYEVASCTVPVVQLDLIINGHVAESVSVDRKDVYDVKGAWNIQVEKSSWCALLVRGRYEGKPEMIAAHSSAVFIEVEGSSLYVEEDALTILEQIEGALAYVNTIGTKAETKRFKEMQLVLESAHRQVHNKMHEMGYFHGHNAVHDHPEHSK